MIIGVLQVEMTVPGSLSLKDKRRVVQSIKAKLHREHMVSVAETGSLGSLTSATLGIVLAAGEVPYCQSVLQNIVEKLKTHRDAVLADWSIQIITGVTPGQEEGLTDQDGDEA